MAKNSDIRLSVYNINGQFIETLIDGEYEAGKYNCNWDASKQPSGLYFLHFHAGSEIFSQKLMVIK